MAHQKLLKKYFISGVIEAITGLHIGGSSNAMSIGGIDNPIIRNPLTNQPYIPGSSLKGKMRSLLQLALGELGSNREFVSDNESQITARLFGMATKDLKRQSRITVRDATLIESSIDLKKTELPYSEVKYENTINRITSEANPRPLERVPAGAKFAFEMVINIMESDAKFNEEGETEEDRLVKHVFKAMRLLQDDYLGGSGTRGSGQIDFNILTVKTRGADFYVHDDTDAEKDIEKFSLDEKGNYVSEGENTYSELYPELFPI